MKSEEKWDLVIEKKSSLFEFGFDKLWLYRDLLFLFVKRDFISIYKQTILGPFWIFIQPVLTTITFTITFSSIANLSTDGVPAVLFYLAGITFWMYFSDCVIKTSNTFITNASIFGKVYFPRLIMPISVIISNLIKLGVQFLLFIAVVLYFLFTTNQIHPNSYILVLPLLIFMVAGLGLGFGIIISSLTTKYRDLTFLIGFGIQLMMYISSVVMPLSMVSKKVKFLLLLNPLTPIIEAFRYAFLGAGYFSWPHLVYSFIFTLILLLLGIVVFNRIERSFIDTV